VKAVRITGYGGPEVLEVDENTPAPTPKADQLFVSVKSVSINPFDLTLIKGFLKEKIPLELPVTLGGDFSGVIAEQSPQVDGLKGGDEVFGQAIVLNGGSGSFAQECFVNKRNVALKPKNLSFEEAGALPLVGASAVQALTEHINLRPGQKILIHGGAGGIGHVALQLAKALGAFVAVTVRSDDIEFVRNLGADEVIDYKNQIFEDMLRGFDSVFDTVGGDITTRSLPVVKKGGVIVSMKGIPDQKIASDYNIKTIGQATITSTDRLNILTRFVENGKIKVHLAKTFSLDEVREAFSFFENEHFTGKVALKVS